MAAYYNEIDPYAAQWLRNLIASGHIAPGDVDTRSIVDVRAEDLKGYTQCHFFAGIGGWSLALRLALWPDDRPVWTGSCPCQPFSAAGKQQAQKDERHLWPVWFRLIAAVRPSVVFGEQVAAAIAHGWLDDAFDDLEREGYQTGAAVLPACSVGAPHKRDRLWFVADADKPRPQGRDGGIMQECACKFIARKSSTPLENSNSRGFSKQGICAEQQGGAEAISTGQAIPNSMFCPTEQGEPWGIGRGFQKGAGKNGGETCWLIEPSVGRVANGIPSRTHKLRAYGNAIVPQLAAEFIKAYMECEP